MNILIITIPVSLALGLGFIAAFVWATRSSQWNDLETPARRILFDQDNDNNNDNHRTVKGN